MLFLPFFILLAFLTTCERFSESFHEIPRPPSVTAAFEHVFNRMYVSNVKNRLRQLNNPSDNDLKRWLFELVQNAKDSIAKCVPKRQIRIIVRATENEVIFEHDSATFTPDTRFALIYQYSQGKGGTESVGRFGTGFLTTHCLSKIVTVESDIIDHKAQETHGFVVTMYRDGDTDEALVSGQERMIQEEKFYEESFNNTRFIYHLKSEANQKAKRFGLDAFKANAGITLLLCPEIQSVELYDDNDYFKWTRGETQVFDDQVSETVFEIVKNGNPAEQLRFVHIGVVEPNAELSERFNTSRNLRLALAIQVDGKFVVKQSDLQPSLFCVFPLIGSETNRLPIFVSSQDFEPDSERDGLILKGELVRQGRPSDVAINQMILKRTIPCFRRLVEHIAPDYHRLYWLARGLTTTPKPAKSFDPEWFFEHVIIPYREVLATFPIVQTDLRKSLLFNETKPYTLFVVNDDENHTLYHLYRDLFDISRFAIEAENDIWSKMVWKECGIRNVQHLCQHLSSYTSFRDVRRQGVARYPTMIAWLNQFYSFLYAQKQPSLMSEYAIIPNLYGDFISFNERSVCSGATLTSTALDCVRDLGHDLRKNLVQSELTSLKVRALNASDIADEIRKLTSDEMRLYDRKYGNSSKVVRHLWPLLRIIPTDLPLEFRQKREAIQFFMTSLWPNLSLPIEGDGLPQDTWEAVDIFMIQCMLRKVASYNTLSQLSIMPHGNLTPEQQIAWLNKFIAFVQQYAPTELNDARNAIVPDRSGTFHAIDELAHDGIDDWFKSQSFSLLGLDFAAKLLHPGIKIELKNRWDMDMVLQLSGQLFRQLTHEQGNARSITEAATRQVLMIGLHMFHALPYPISPFYESRVNILHVIRIVFASEVTKFTNYSSNSSEALIQPWVSPVLEALISRVEVCQNINSFPAAWGNPVAFLRKLYLGLRLSPHEYSNASIYPNRNGAFQPLSQLRRSHLIPPELLTVGVKLLSDTYKLMVQFSIPKSGLEDRIETRLIYPDLENEIPAESLSVHEFCSDIDSEIVTIYTHRDRLVTPEIRANIAYIYARYIEPHDEESQMFPHFLGQRTNIVCDVLFDRETRELVSALVGLPKSTLQEIIAAAKKLAVMNIQIAEAEKQLERLKLDGKAILN